jgi:hypothetical protein
VAITTTTTIRSSDWQLHKTQEWGNQLLLPSHDFRQMKIFKNEIQMGKMFKRSFTVKKKKKKDGGNVTEYPCPRISL